ncbi:MAG: polymerase sigma-70 factor, subfamily [Chloroflexota bacterium]|nr:polymerase sigma-70 factor, subfamily [Chloroflexota bacterium]
MRHTTHTFDGSCVAFRPEIADFAALYERTYAAAYRTAYGICGDSGMAEDVTQDAYVAAYRDREKFRGEAPVAAWIQRIVVNTAISAVRRRKIVWLEPLDEHRHDRPVGSTPDALDAISVQSAMASLSSEQRAAVVLRYYHDFDYATIAAILETTSGNVGSLLSRAMVRLRAGLDDASARPSHSRPVEAGHVR